MTSDLKEIKEWITKNGNLKIDESLSAKHDEDEKQNGFEEIHRSL